MNQKIGGILSKAWNEPRHFCFWLMLAGALGLVTVCECAGLGHPALPVAVAVVGLDMCFMAGAAGFILAWIPPVRRLFSWLLRRRLVTLVWIITLAALVYAEENWRGRRAWQAYKRGREAQGEQLDLAGLAPPPVPDDQNFFDSPLWNDLRDAQTNGSLAWNDTNSSIRVIFDAFGPKGGNSPSTGNWAAGQHVDLVAWQAFYRGSNNPIAAKNHAPTNYFPVAKEPQSPAADVLYALSKFKENRQLLVEAAARPRARLSLNYDTGYLVGVQLLPYLTRTKAAAQYLSLHANAALKAGDTETALEDVRLLFRLEDALGGEPYLIGYLVRVAANQIALEPVWEGLAGRRWSEGDLSLIETDLGKMDFLADYSRALCGERVCGLWGIDCFRRMGFAISVPPEQVDAKGFENFLGGAVLQVIPSGWFELLKASYCRRFDTAIPTAEERERRVLSPEAVKALEAAASKPRFSLGDMMARMGLPSFDRAKSRAAVAQTSVDLARLGCALERYRLANGQFPETLEGLAPKFIASVPHDIINGQPLKYRRTEDGQFVLYSIGWNEKDDGGKVGLKNDGRPDVMEGDWVWKY